MNTVIAIDFLLERNRDVFLLEGLLTRYQDAQIICLAHKPNSIQGTVESRKIYSSFLSSLIKEPKDLNKYLWLIPAAVKSLKYDHYDELIIISSGFIHHLERKVNKKVIYHTDRPSLSYGGFNRLFKGYLEKFRYQVDPHHMHQLTSSKTLAQHLCLPTAPVIESCFNSKEFFLENKQENLRERKHFIYPAHYQEEKVMSLVEFLLDEGQEVFFWGSQEEYSALWKRYSQRIFWEEKGCEGSFANLANQAQYFWDFNQRSFPYESFQALCCGCFPIRLESEFSKEFFEQGKDCLIFSPSKESFFKVINLPRTKPEVLRRKGLHFNQRLFKNRFFGYVQESLGL